MKIRLSQELVEKFPGIQAAVIVLNNIKNEKKLSNISQLMRGVTAQRKLEFKDEEKKKNIGIILQNGRVDEKMLQEVQLLESKVKKAGAGRELGNTNNLEGLLNYLSVKYLVPVFGYDLDEVEKDLEINLIKPKQGKHPDDFIFLPTSKHIVIWLIDIGSVEKDQFARLPAEFCKIIQKYCGGTLSNTQVINADVLEADLNYTSEKEKAYLETLQKEAAKPEPVFDEATGQQLPDFLADQGSSPKPQQLIPDLVKDLAKAALKEYLVAHNALKDELIDQLELHTPAEQNHGDYACNIAMKLAKEMQKSPQEIAESIIQLFPKNDLIDKAETAGPGFINIYLSQNFLQKELQNIISLKQNYGRLGIGQGQKVAIDYSSPNIAKPLGVHHLLSTVIGQTITNLLRFSGYKVFALNFPGDWGTQFGKLLYAYKTWGDRSVIEKDPLNELLKIYVKFHQEAEKDPTLEDRGREEFKKLEEGDNENLELWKWMNQISIRELERIYQKLDVHFDEYLGEYIYLESAREIVKEGKEKGVITEGENGAWVVRFENDKYPPYILQKSDGTTIYATRDLASIRDRIERLKAKTLLYVVDVAQTLHFNQLFETARKFGYTDINFRHVVFGRMLLPEGKMSTRKGEIILLDEVIKEAALRAQKLVDEKSKDLSLQEKEQLAQSMAVSAIKYNIISQNRETNITFDLDRMLSMEGNSAPYLEYTLARANSILRKSASQQLEKKTKPVIVKDQNQTDLFSLAEARIMDENISPANPEEKPFGAPAEQSLLHFLIKMPESVLAASENYKPNILATYLYDLARAFNNFYDKVSVLAAADEQLRASRLNLVEATAIALRNGLTVLGIAVLDKM